MIDIQKMIITGKSGRVYKIMPESISAARYSEYSLRSSLLAFKTDFETLFTSINKAIEHLRHGKENSIGNAMNAAALLENIQKGMMNFQENNRPAIIEFVSLFVIGDGEDVSKHSEDQIRVKYEDWAHIPIVDFFLLASHAIPKFKECLIEILGKENPSLLQEIMTLRKTSN